MKWQPYPKYKDSGVEWIGEVPEGWEVARLKHVASLKGRLGWQGLRADEYTEEGPYLVTSEHFSNEKVDWARCHHVSPTRYSQAPAIQLRPDDLLMMKDGAAMGKLAYVEWIPGPACLNSHLLLFRPLDGRFANRFLFYGLGGPSFRSYMTQERTGTTFFGISQESIGSFCLALPLIKEQHQILDFLNRETAKIDTLIAKQERLIELLQEKRQALISHAVTKGINPDAPIKPSGAEWLGDVPAGWQITKLKFLVNGIEQGWSPECHSSPAGEEEWGVLKAGCCNGGLFDPSDNKALPLELAPSTNLEVRPGDVLMSRASGSLDLIGSVAVVPTGCRTQLLLSDKIYRLRVDDSIADRSYLAHLLGSLFVRSQIRRVVSGASGLANNIAQADVKEIVVPLPPQEEQRAISSRLSLELTKLDSLRAAAQAAITLMREHRTALISAAVTGKIDVREPIHA
jgi:type I restriction enzyme S subunit